MAENYKVFKLASIYFYSKYIEKMWTCFFKFQPICIGFYWPLYFYKIKSIFLQCSFTKSFLQLCSVPSRNQTQNVAVWKIRCCCTCVWSFEYTLFSHRTLDLRAKIDQAVQVTYINLVKPHIFWQNVPIKSFFTGHV